MFPVKTNQAQTFTRMVMYFLGEKLALSGKKWKKTKKKMISVELKTIFVNLYINL